MNYTFKDDNGGLSVLKIQTSSKKLFNITTLMNDFPNGKNYIQDLRPSCINWIPIIHKRNTNYKLPKQYKNKEEE
jgi:hypothetical protein